MVAYFRRQNNLFMLSGAVVMLLAAAPFYRNWLPKQEFYVKAFFLALPVFTGIVAGRIGASVWANRRLHRLDELLYQKAEPLSFIREFTPLVEKVPRQTIEYVNGCVKLAYAYEALGEFEKSLGLIKDLKPEKLRLHALAASSLMVNQKIRVYLLKEDLCGAREQLENLRDLQKAAEGRVPALVSNLKECIRLAEVWLEFLEGKNCDENYIEEEMNLANNKIHKGEMQLLLAKIARRQGEDKKAKELLYGLKEYAAELYAGKEAEKLIGETSPVLSCSQFFQNT